ncbi:MAG TPA: ChuX/HutX family heme-like substrate-binding protein [Kofleriaceae bacterium]
MTQRAATELAAQWQALRSAKPMVRTRDAAAELGVSEAELVASWIGSRDPAAVRLADDPAGLLHALTEVGRCMALTRNESCVSEVRGTYGGIELGPHAGQVVGDAIDLRVFLSHWAHLYAIDEAHPQRAGERRRSIHVFDHTGTAVHKIYLEPEADPRTWDAIVASRTHRAPLVVEPAPSHRVERPDLEIDREALVAGWDAMTDTHEFFHLLGKHRATRTQALRLAGEDRARQVRPGAMQQLLEDAARTPDKIMIFVGNRGCIQIFSGAVGKIAVHGPWLNVLDPGFNLHLRTDRIATSWVVNKPTSAGTVRSLELFDADGDTIALVFRKRDDRERAEDAAWGAMLDRLTA